MKLEKPYFIRDLATIDRVPDGTKRCRICKEVKKLAEFRMINSKGKSWPNYACMPCSKELQREAYRRGSPNENQVATMSCEPWGVLVGWRCQMDDG